jgi:hypothetical protein
MERGRRLNKEKDRFLFKVDRGNKEVLGLVALI